jgi:hypothetical protein
MRRIYHDSYTFVASIAPASRYNVLMNLEAILSAIDSEISRLQQARAMLADTTPSVVAKKGPGRPKKLAVVVPAKKRTMSAEGRIRIAAAQKKRWAAAKKAK